MSLEQKPLDDVDEYDLQSLVDSSVAERKTIEYKSELPGGSDSEKKEFLADVSSFANASGGHLVFGIEAKDGVPISLKGLDVPSADKAVLRLDDMLRSGIRERIPGHYIHPVTLKNGRTAIVMRVPHSWNAPHMVVYQDWSRFYSRNSNGKYLLDVGEIRSAFLRSEAAADRIRNFRADRIARIVAEEFPTPAPLADAPKLVLHVVPLGAFDSGTNVDVTRCTEDTALQGMLRPLGELSWAPRFNFDGFLTFSRDRGPDTRLQPPRAYVQLFRNGCIEGVSANILGLPNRNKRISTVAHEKYTLESLADYLKALERLGIEPPLFVMLTLVGVAGYEIAIPRGSFAGEGNPIDRDVLVIPETLIESREDNPAQMMKPSFDAIWNASGWPRSKNYDEQGNWMPNLSE